MVATVPYDGYANHRPLADVHRENWDSYWDKPGTETLSTETPTKEPVSKVVKSRIRVLLSRTLTWAEREDITTDYADVHFRRLDGENTFDGLKLWMSPNGKHVWAEAPYGSRPLYELVAKTLENNYVNVFPRAVRTFREYNGE
jgi:hypothetical protein